MLGAVYETVTVAETCVNQRDSEESSCYPIGIEAHTPRICLRQPSRDCRISLYQSTMAAEGDEQITAI